MTDETNIIVLNDGISSDLPTPTMLVWVRNSTSYRLGRQMMTERQLADGIRKKARQKFEGINEAQLKALADTAVKFGHDMKALDDIAYAGISARSGARNGKSKRMIAQKLSQKGVDRETVSLALEDSDDLFAAVVFARKRAFGPFRRGELDDRHKAKELSAFARNGFGFELGKTVFAMSLEEAEEVLHSAALG